MLLRAIDLSLDPHMQGRMDAGESFAAPVEVGDVMGERTVAEVVNTQLDRYQAGDNVFHPGHGWQEYALSDGKGVRKVDPSAGPISSTHWACWGCRDSPPTPD